MCFWRKPWNTPFAHRLRFEKTEVHPVKDLVGVSAGDNPWFVGVVRHGLVADAAIGDEVGAWLDRSGVEAMQRLRRPVENPFQPNPPGVPVLRELDSPNRSDFPGRIRFLGRAHGGALGRAPGGVCLAPEGHPGLVDLDDLLQQAPVRIDHRPAQLVQQKPGGLGAADADLSLQLKSRDAVRMAGDNVRGDEPGA